MSVIVAEFAAVAASVVVAVAGTSFAVQWFTADDCTDAMGSFTGRKRAASAPPTPPSKPAAPALKDAIAVAATAIDVITTETA